MDPARRAQLLGGKLRALSIECLGCADPKPVAYFAGAAAFDAASSTFSVLVEPATEDRDPLDVDPLGPRPPRGWLGGAIVAAVRAGAARLELLGDGSLLNGDDARRAARSAVPARCWSVVGRGVAPVDPVEAPALLGLSDLPADEQPFAAQITAAGADPVVELGVLRAEVLGLEVARVQRDPVTDEAFLAVGVGRHDRLAQSMMNAGAEPTAALRDAIEAVRVHRVPGAPMHPANTLARSRWLRELVLLDPTLAGLPREAALTRIEGTVPADLKSRSVACATTERDGGTVVVGCAVGVDLEAATDLLDVAAVVAHGTVPVPGPGVDCVLVLPSADRVGAITTLAGSLTSPIRVVPVEEPFARAE